MTFLAPIPAIVAAAVTVPALLVLYLLKLRRRPVRVSSTLLWTARTRDLQVNVPLRWLRPSWLLFLQLLVLALFLLALARPAIDAAALRASRAVLIIDRTASMSARDGEGAGGGGGLPGMGGATRLDEAKADAERLIEGLVGGGGSGGGAEACLVELSAEPRTITGFTRDRSALIQAVRAIEPTDQPGDLAEALRLAGALLAQSGDDAGEGEGGEGGEGGRTAGLVVLFSDGGFEERGALTLGGAEFRFERAGPGAESAAGSGVPAARGIDNLGIAAVSARRDYEDPATVRVFTRLLNASAAAVSAPVVVSLDGEAVERRAVVIPGAEGGPPGETGFTAEVRTAAGGLVTVSIGREDVLEADNGAAVVLAGAARPRIWLVVPDSEDAGEVPVVGGGPEWLLADPLREMRARSFRMMSAATYEASAGAGAVEADLVVFDRVTPARAPNVPTISFGAGVPVPGGELERGATPGTSVLTWERSSPVLRNVSLDSLYVSRAGSFAPAAEEERVERRALAAGRDGPLIVELQDGGVRRLVVSFALPDSNWPLDFGFPIFLADAVDYLTMRAEDQVSGGAATFTTAQPAVLHVPRVGGAGGASHVTLTGPVTLRVPVPEGQTRVSLGAMERAGVYRVEVGGGGGGGGEEEPRFLAVNLVNETESALATRDSLQVSGETVNAAGAAAGGPREIWHWFVMAALVLLAIEWFLHAWLMRA